MTCRELDLDANSLASKHSPYLMISLSLNNPSCSPGTGCGFRPQKPVRVFVFFCHMFFICCPSFIFPFVTNSFLFHSTIFLFVPSFLFSLLAALLEFEAQLALLMRFLLCFVSSIFYFLPTYLLFRFCSSFSDHRSAGNAFN